MNLNLQSLQSAVDRRWKTMHAVCAHRRCRNTMLMRSVPQSRVGIRVGELWYCGVDCFAEAAFRRFSTVNDGRVVEMPHNPRLSIGLALLSKGFVTDDELRFAVNESQLSGEELEATLVRLGLASEKRLASARAAQWGCPVLGQEGSSQPIEADIPPTLLRTCWAAPLRYSQNGKRLLMGFVYRVEHRLLLAMEEVTGCRAEPCFITQTGFEEQMARLTPAPECDEVVHEKPQTPKEMANTVAQLAIDAAARKVIFVECRDYFWTRLFGRRGTVDVLFRHPSRCN
jgi:Type II secretion system (T2SS), protein E, N-terminal domain